MPERKIRDSYNIIGEIGVLKKNAKQLGTLYMQIELLMFQGKDVPAAMIRDALALFINVTELEEKHYERTHEAQLRKHLEKAIEHFNKPNLKRHYLISGQYVNEDPIFEIPPKYNGGKATKGTPQYYNVEKMLEVCIRRCLLWCDKQNRKVVKADKPKLISAIFKDLMAYINTNFSKAHKDEMKRNSIGILIGYVLLEVANIPFDAPIKNIEYKNADLFHHARTTLEQLWAKR